MYYPAILYLNLIATDARHFTLMAFSFILLLLMQMWFFYVYRSKPEFRMRTKAHQSQCVVIWFLINQNQVGFDMAIPMILPLASQSMVTVARLQGLVSEQG